MSAVQPLGVLESAQWKIGVRSTTQKKIPGKKMHLLLGLGNGLNVHVAMSG